MLWEIFGPLAVVFLIMLWVFEGFALKYVDQVVDEGREVRKILLWTVIFIAGVAAGFFMTTDAFTGGSVLALVFAMILSKKIDNRLWFTQIIIVFGSYIVFLHLFVAHFSWLIAGYLEVFVVFIFVLVFSIVDEYIHAACEKASRLIKWFGEWRFTMKIVVVIMALFLPQVEWYHALSWILFDITYEVTARLFTRNQKVAKPEPLLF